MMSFALAMISFLSEEGVGWGLWVLCCLLHGELTVLIVTNE